MSDVVIQLGARKTKTDLLQALNTLDRKASKERRSLGPKRNNGPPAGWLDLAEELRGVLTFRPDVINTLATKTRDRTSKMGMDRELMLLPHSVKSGAHVAALGLRWQRYTDDDGVTVFAEFTVYLTLFRALEGGDPGAPEVGVAVLRFETPSQPGGAGGNNNSRHDYYHCQPTDPRDQQLVNLLQVDDKICTIPVKANTPLELLGAALKTYYGRTELGQHFPAGSTLAGPLGLSS